MIKRNELTDSRGGTRTPDPLINSQLLYRLSYPGKVRKTSPRERVTQGTELR